MSRNHDKRKKYMELVVDLVKRERLAGEDFQVKEWSLLLCQNIDHAIWKIFYRQVENIHPNDLQAPSAVLTQKLLTNSLLALQEEYDESLPRRSEEVSSYL